MNAPDVLRLIESDPVFERVLPARVNHAGGGGLAGKRHFDVDSGIELQRAGGFDQGAMQVDYDRLTLAREACGTDVQVHADGNAGAAALIAAAIVRFRR